MGARMGVLAVVASALGCGATPTAAATVAHRWKGDNDANDVNAQQRRVDRHPTFTAGALNQAFSFDGAAYVSVPDDPSHYPAGSFTVDCSARPPRQAAARCSSRTTSARTRARRDSASSDIDLGLIDGIAHAYVRDIDAGGTVSGGQEVIGGASLADGAFHRYAFVRDVEAGKLALYIDGIEVAEQDLEQAAAGPLGNDDGEADPITIGAYIGGGRSAALGRSQAPSTR